VGAQDRRLARVHRGGSQPVSPKILLVADVPGWAFDVNNRDMARFVPGFDFSHFYITNGSHLPMTWDYDAVFLPMHSWIPGWPYCRLVGALRSQWFDGQRRVPPTAADRAKVQRCAAFQVCTRQNEEELFDLGVTYLTNPVDHRRFPVTPTREIVACWTGNALHMSGGGEWDIKGFYSVVIPACTMARVRLIAAEYNTYRLPPERMPAFFAGASVVLCASLYEGASNSVMEAMAAGLAVIATDVGNHREIVESELDHFGDSGILLVQRSPDAFAAALQMLTPARAREMGEINRQEIARRWSWEVWADRYKAFFQKALDA